MSSSSLFLIQSTNHYKSFFIPQVLKNYYSYNVPYKCSNELVTAVSSIDRAWFSTSEVNGCASKDINYFKKQWMTISANTNLSNCKFYDLNPARLGFGVNMSAPGMHILGLAACQEVLRRQNLRILDVGCSTGYTTVQFATTAYLLGGEIKEIIGMDHVDEFIKIAKVVIDSIVSEKSSFLDKIKFICKDARSLNPNNDGIFDLIHTGAAVPLDQVENYKNLLKVDGVLIGPVQESAQSQAYVKYTKTRTGIQREVLLNVIYTGLISFEEQIKQR